jgi:hypothetical protein
VLVIDAWLRGLGCARGYVFISRICWFELDDSSQAMRHPRADYMRGVRMHGEKPDDAASKSTHCILYLECSLSTPFHHSLFTSLYWRCNTAGKLYERQQASNASTHRFFARLLWRDYLTFFWHEHAGVVLSGAEHRGATAPETWNANTAHLDRWKEGTTGVPLVDATMRELAATGCPPPPSSPSLESVHGESRRMHLTYSYLAYDDLTYSYLAYDDLTYSYLAYDDLTYSYLAYDDLTYYPT